MKRLFLPALLVLATLVFAAVVTTVTAVTLESYAKENKSNSTVIQQQPIEGSTVQR